MPISHKLYENKDGNESFMCIFSLGDALGSVRQLADASGNATEDHNLALLAFELGRELARSEANIMWYRELMCCGDIPLKIFIAP